MNTSGMCVSRSPESAAMPSAYPTGMPRSSATARTPNTTPVMLLSSSPNMWALQLRFCRIVLRLGLEVALNEADAGQCKRQGHDDIDPLHRDLQRQARLRPFECAAHEQCALPDHEQVEAEPDHVAQHEAPAPERR